MMVPVVDAPESTTPSERVVLRTIALKKASNSDPVFWTNQHVVNLFGCEPTQALTLNLGLLGATSQRQAIHIEVQNRAEVSRPMAALSPTDTYLAQICELDLVRR